MSILEKFLILFDSDADDAAKDVKKLNRSLDKTEDSAQDATRATGSTTKQFAAMGVKALGAVGGVVALTGVLAGLVTTASRIDEIAKFAKSIGASVEDVDAWSQAVVRAGGDVDGFKDSLVTLNEQFIEAATTGENETGKFLERFGIAMKDTTGEIRPTLDIMSDLSDAFAEVGEQEALAIGKKMGLDEGTIMLMQSGSDEIEKLIERQKQLGVVSEEAAIVSAKFNDAIADFKQITGFAAQNLLITFVPAITWTIEKLVDLSIWLNENKPIVIGFFAGIAAVAVPALASLAVTGWAAVAPMLAMAAPFIAIGAAAGIAGAAIALVIEDIIAFSRGHDSLLGQMIEKWPILGDVIQFIVDDIKAFIGMIQSLWGLLTQFGQFLINMFIAPQKALDSFKASLQALINMVMNFIGETYEKLKSAVSSVKSFFTFGSSDDDEEQSPGGMEKEEEPKSKKKSFFGFGGSDDDEQEQIKRNIDAGKNSIAATASNPIASQTTNSITNANRTTNKTTSVQTGDINIQTQATDSKGIAENISGSLEEEMRTTVENFDDGVAI